MNTSHPDWNAVLGHELRTPVAAILGYQELLEDGTLGPLPPAAADALRRIRLAAAQLITLVDAVEGSSNGDPPESFPAADLIHDAIATVSFDAEGRSTRIDVGSATAELTTHRLDACRALALALGAAVKVTPAGALRVTTRDDGPRIVIAGSRLHPDRDRVRTDHPLTGAALRLELAGAAAVRTGGRIDLLDDGSLHLVLPPRPAG